jgi:cell wall-associated NlpC family hydrolase
MLIQTIKPTPVLNTPDFSFAFGGKIGNQIPVNEKGHPYLYEFVALKGTRFEVEEIISDICLRVSCPFYPGHLFLDSRFTKPARKSSSPSLPAPNTILKRMKSRLGMPYVWGGNWSAGIPETLSFYPPKGPLDPRTETLWTFKGLDCSGLLFEATRGATPRNTSQLLNFGKPLKISNLTSNQMASVVLPLDMIIYPGHVLFVLDSCTTIESKSPFGVICRDLKSRLEEILSERKPVDESSEDLSLSPFFQIRRFA